MQDPTSPIDSPTSPTSPFTPFPSTPHTTLPFRHPTPPPRISKPPHRRPSKHLRRSSNPNSRVTLSKAIAHLRVPLVPLISLTTGKAHPAFPLSLLQFHLLTHAQLDDLARFYHQVWPPLPETSRYPDMMKTWIKAEAQRQQQEGGEEEDVGLETKRMRWGRFIGLRGCESPTTNEAELLRSAIQGAGGVAATAEQTSLEERMEREWRAAIDRAREEAERREKMWR
ncbi:MAG: hypothetical protein Q9160_001716 [Pyrenula sp. 1 TL-2023]